MYHAIAQHTVLVMAVLAECAVTATMFKHRTGSRAPSPARPGQPPSPDPGLIQLTVPEVRRLIAATALLPLPPGQVIHWSACGYRARANCFQPRTRLEGDRQITMNSLVI